jgi:hypothetical protein
MTHWRPVVADIKARQTKIFSVKDEQLFGKPFLVHFLVVGSSDANAKCVLRSKSI